MGFCPERARGYSQRFQPLVTGGTRPALKGRRRRVPAPLQGAGKGSRVPGDKSPVYISPPFQGKGETSTPTHTCKGVGGEFVTAMALNMENPPLPLPGEESGVCAAKNLPFRGRAVKFSFHAPRGMPVPRRSAAWTGRRASDWSRSTRSVLLPSEFRT